MTINEINSLTIESCTDELMNRLIGRGAQPEEITQEELNNEFEGYIQELTDIELIRLEQKARYNQMVIEYNLIQHDQKQELLGDEAIEELEVKLSVLKELIAHDLAVIRFDALEITLTVKPTVDLSTITSDQFNGICDSLEQQDADAKERLRIDDLQKRLDFIGDIGHQVLDAIGHYRANIAHFRNVELIGKDFKNPLSDTEAELLMQSIESKFQEMKSAKDKEETKRYLYESMVSDIYDQMEIVFGTRNDVSAQANASTWEAMLKRPENYISVTGLASVESVTQYAQSKLLFADQYAVYRVNRINQYLSEKAIL